MRRIGPLLPLFGLIFGFAFAGTPNRPPQAPRIGVPRTQAAWKSSKTAGRKAAPAKAKIELVYITHKGHVYHRANCKLLTCSSYPVSKAYALRMGYKPCKWCGG